MIHWNVPNVRIPWLRAFTDYCHKLVARKNDNDESVERVKTALQQLLETDFLLTDMIPALKQFGNNPHRATSTDSVTGTEG